VTYSWFSYPHWITKHGQPHIRLPEFIYSTCVFICCLFQILKHAVAQLVEALRYKPQNLRVRFPMVSLKFFIDIILHAPPLNISWWKWRPVRRADNLTTFMCRLSHYLWASAFWNPHGLYRDCFISLACFFPNDILHLIRPSWSNTENRDKLSRIFCSPPEMCVTVYTDSGIYILLSDASSSNEAVHLQQRLRSLSTELVTLRNRLHVSQPAATVPPPLHAATNNNSNNNNNNNHHSNNIHGSAPCTVAANQQPVIPPRHNNLPALPQHINTVGKYNSMTNVLDGNVPMRSKF